MKCRTRLVMGGKKTRQQRCGNAWEMQRPNGEYGETELTQGDCHTTLLRAPQRVFLANAVVLLRRTHVGDGRGNASQQAGSAAHEAQMLGAFSRDGDRIRLSK